MMEKDVINMMLVGLLCIVGCGIIISLGNSGILFVAGLAGSNLYVSLRGMKEARKDGK